MSEMCGTRRAENAGPKKVAKNRHLVMVALPYMGGALCSMPQSLADAHYLTAVQ